MLSRSGEGKEKQTKKLFFAITDESRCPNGFTQGLERLNTHLFLHISDGSIDYHELKVSLRALGFEVKKAEVLKILKDYDREETGKIGFDDFKEVATDMMLERDPMQELLKVSCEGCRLLYNSPVVGFSIPCLSICIYPSVGQTVCKPFCRTI